MRKPPKVSIDLMKPLMLSLLCKILYFLLIDNLNLLLRLKKVFLVIMLCGILTSTRASPNVKPFNGNPVLYSDHLVKYFMLKFPSLVNLRLTSYCNNIYKEVMVKFLQYVMNMSEASVESFRIKQVPDLLVSFLKETPWYDGPL